MLWAFPSRPSRFMAASGKEVQDQIIVELPGIDDPDRVKRLIENTAQLELRLVKKDQGGPFSSIESPLQANGGSIPAGLFRFFLIGKIVARDREPTSVPGR